MKLLIANRGEIACRIIRTAQRMGIACVAVYTVVDAKAKFVQMADEAVAIENYLSIPALLEAAKQSGATAVHPGYGFLSENADFAEAVGQAGLVFVGPTPAAIRAMGDKANAKQLMQKAGVPLLAGYEGSNQSDAAFLSAAQEIGFPLILKPAAGGGGKGMKIARHMDEMPALLASARREAKLSFGDERLILEKYLERPRHVEVQVFGDTHGHVVHLFERDCTLQRRHQKVIEEAPAPDLPDATRSHLHESAIKAARAVGYVGAGTVEFLLAKDGQPYFMEMNTRLQVEHPVTEAITGFDLVEWQLRVAQGEALPVTQEQIKATGHAFEARLYAEDPAVGFLPQIGTIQHLHFPETARIESGVRAGDSITIHYDPMIAKIITHANSRTEALAALGKALDDTEVVGLITNRDFLRRLTHEPTFPDISWLDREAERLATMPKPKAEHAAQLAVNFYWQQKHNKNTANPWQRGDGWRGFLVPLMQLWLKDEDGVTHHLKPDGAFVGRGVVTDNTIHLFLNGEDYAFTLASPLTQSNQSTEADHHLRSPMPGRITAVYVKAGDKVQKGAPLVVLEAMKMEHTLRAPANGVVVSLRCAAGEQVSAGVDLVEWENEA